MPIEIKELHIRLTVDNQPASRRRTGQGASAESEGDDADRDAIVTECVEQVLRILDAKKDR